MPAPRLLRSIHARLTLALLAGGGALILGGSLALWVTISGAWRGNFDRALEAEGRAVASLLSVTAEGLRLDYADEAMPEFSTKNDPAYFEVRRRDGTLVESSDSLGDSVLGPVTLPARTETVDDVTLPNGERGRRITLLIAPLLREADERAHVKPLGGEERPASVANAVAYVSVARSVMPLTALLGRLRWGIAGWAVGMLLGIVLLVVAALRWGFRPLGEAAREIEQMHADTLDRRLDQDAVPAELRPFVERVNDLLLRLERSFERERDFSANVAHELRTPLAELRSLCDVALAGDGASPELAAFFVDAREVGMGMERIVDALLSLRASEAGAEPARRQRFALQPALDQSWQPFAALAAHRGLAVRMACGSDIVVHTDREKLLLILSNLLSNAAQYAAPSTWIEVQTRNAPDAVELTIGNPAPDLATDDVERVLDRFWRKTAARENDGHLGLGLPLAAALARALGIDLGVALTPARVLELSLRLPA
jgi:two-component system sensor histidine kinase QseC